MGRNVSTAFRVRKEEGKKREVFGKKERWKKEKRKKEEKGAHGQRFVGKKKKKTSKNKDKPPGRRLGITRRRL